MQRHFSPAWLSRIASAMALSGALAAAKPLPQDGPPAAIQARELATHWMRAAKGIAVVDLRPSSEFAASHLPGAVNLTAGELATTTSKSLGEPRLVVVTGPDAEGAQRTLRANGLADVRVLTGGLAAFEQEVLADATPASAGALARAFFRGDGKASQKGEWATDPAALTSPTMVSPAWLAERQRDVVVLDTRPAADYAALHIDGALSLEPSKVRVRAGDRDLLLVDDAALARTFGGLGITATTPVVIYADDKLHDATFVALSLLRVGHRAVAVLEGGILRWAAERRPLSATVPTPKLATYEVRPGADDFTITTDELAQQVADGSRSVLDVRPGASFRGEQSTEARPGHIPGAKNRTFSTDIDRDATGHWLKSRAELEKSYGAAFGKDQPFAVSCRTGHSASHSYFVLRHLLGYQNVRWYNGSWTEWSARQDLPAATGDK
jgi:3-mercaptopyruvate sulfurtransferase SseA